VVMERPGLGGELTVAFAGGGTGGHLFPAMAVADALAERVPGVRFLFFGTQRAIDARIVERADCHLIRQRLDPLSGRPWRWPALVSEYLRSARDCFDELSRRRSAVVIGSGGYSSVPPLWAARRAGIPLVLLNPDAVPGRANRLFARHAELVFAQWEATAEYLSSWARVEVVGCPIRPDFARADRVAGLRRFELRPTCKTLLVTGASQGARTLNEAVLWILKWLAGREDWQVLHLTGELDLERVQRAYASSGVSSCVLAFTPHMAEALAAADLVVSRAGASTLAEITALGKPSILLPYPFHRDRHQHANARCLVRAGAARLVADSADAARNGPALREVLEELMTDDARRSAMAAAAQRMGRGQAAGHIAERLLQVAGVAGVAGAGESLKGTCAAAR